MSSSSYLPRLDGIRALAIGFVLLEHFSTRPFFVAIGIGGIGVRIFFVLSGFLITRILLDYRAKDVAPSKAAKQFYWRRLLRLSPPYYLAIALTAALGVARMDRVWWIHCLYLSNFYVLWVGHWYASSHLWSLSVEEQFYLLWFLVVMVLPRRFLLPIIRRLHYRCAAIPGFSHTSGIQFLRRLCDVAGGHGRFGNRRLACLSRHVVAC